METEEVQSVVIIPSSPKSQTSPKPQVSVSAFPKSQVTVSASPKSQVTVSAEVCPNEIEAFIKRYRVECDNKENIDPNSNILDQDDDDFDKYFPANVKSVYMNANTINIDEIYNYLFRDYQNSEIIEPIIEGNNNNSEEDVNKTVVVADTQNKDFSKQVQNHTEAAGSIQIQQNPDPKDKEMEIVISPPPTIPNYGRKPIKMYPLQNETKENVDSTNRLTLNPKPVVHPFERENCVPKKVKKNNLRKVRKNLSKQVQNHRETASSIQVQQNPKDYEIVSPRPTGSKSICVKIHNETKENVDATNRLTLKPKPSVVHPLDTELKAKPNSPEKNKRKSLRKAKKKTLENVKIVMQRIETLSEKSKRSKKIKRELYYQIHDHTSIIIKLIDQLNDMQ